MSQPGFFACRAFRVPRRGFDMEECDDACAVSAERGRLAVADGAAESAHAGLWARLLTEAFVRDEAPWPLWIAGAQRRWAELTARTEEEGPLPWFLEDRERLGAFATFLGVAVDEGGWR